MRKPWLRSEARRLGWVRSLGVLAAASGAALALGGPASAGPLASATLVIKTFGIGPATFPGAGATGSATSNLGASLGGTDVFNGTVSLAIPTTAAPPLTGIQVIVTKNAAGAFTGTTPGQVGGSLGIGGVIHVDGIGGFPSGGPPLLSVPLLIGTPNTIIAPSKGGISVTAISAGWTAGTAVVPGGASTPSVTMMGSNALTPGGGGTLVLVTPTRVLTNVAGTLAVFGVLSLTYVPEPGTWALLGLGVAGLAALARRRS